jgi:aminoglycoside 3-N-acetyltransferase
MNERPKQGSEIGKDRIKADLRKIGVAKGSHVAVALSLKSIGHVTGGADTVIDALLEAVGPKGTIMMHTFTNLFPLSKIPNDYHFAQSTKPNTGLVPRNFLKRPETIRSRHPAVSVAAAGKLAKYLTKDHDERSEPYLPYQKLAQINGKYLAIGIGNRLVGIRHEAQRMAGLWVVPMLVGTQYLNRDGVRTLFVWALPPCVKNAPQLVPPIEEMGIIKRGKIGNAPSIIAPAKELIETMANFLKKDPTLNLCDDIFCLQCRELEKRMGLYSKIVNQRLFQRNLFTRKLIEQRNKMILKKYSYVSYAESSRKNRIDLINLLEYPPSRIVRLITFILQRLKWNRESDISQG